MRGKGAVTPAQKCRDFSRGKYKRHSCKFSHELTSQHIRVFTVDTGSDDGGPIDGGGEDVFGVETSRIIAHGSAKTVSRILQRRGHDVVIHAIYEVIGVSC